MKVEVKYCPNCGSKNIKWVNPVMWSLWICYDCGYEGPIIIDDRSLAEEIRKNYLKAENQNEESE